MQIYQKAAHDLRSDGHGSRPFRPRVLARRDMAPGPDRSVVGSPGQGNRIVGRWEGDGYPMASDPSGEGLVPSFDERFAGIVRPVVGQLVHVARRILGSDDLAWEAVQEALLSLWLQGSPPPNPRAWLVRAVVHRSLHLGRSNRRRRQHEARACHRRAEASDQENPARLVLAEEARDALRAAVEELGDTHRLVLGLHLIEELDYESIARRLGIPIGTVRSRLSRAREALRVILGRNFPDP